MNTTKKQLQYATAALMFILLAVFLIDNPIKGSYEDPNRHQDIAVYMCIFYVITAAWFWNNTLDQKTRSRIFIVGALIGLLGVIGQFIALNTDFKEYYEAIEEYRGSYHEGWDFEVYEDHYPITERSYTYIIAICTSLSYIALLGLLCAKTKNKLSRCVLFVAMAFMLFSLISHSLPLEKPDLESSHEELMESREKIQFISMGLILLSWGAVMLTYKEESEEKADAKAEAPAAAPEPIVAAPEPKVAVAPEVTSDETVLANMKATPRRTGALSTGTALQDGRYVIEKVLAQSGLGVTYLATQRGLNRKVAIKEFFMKEYSMETEGSIDMVAKFKDKFIKEAQTMAELYNQHIVRVYDIFEENESAYYVMDYINGDSLAKRVLGHPMDNATTLKYMNQICQALKYIHDRHILHLDIKPSNILFRNNDELVLTDFGISKQYAQEDGAQTRSTPIGISSGYAPLELYSKGSITQFTPATDIYSLGATLYTIVTGKIPPDANEIYEDGLDEFSDKISPAIQNAIIKAMDPRRKQRPQSIDEFTKILNS